MSMKKCVCCDGDIEAQPIKSSSFHFYEYLQASTNEGLSKIRHHDSKHETRFDTPPSVSQKLLLSDATDDYEYLNPPEDKNNTDKPWKQYPYYFQTVKISMVAMLKMVTHAISGGSIEIMGMLLGYHNGNDLFVLDCYPLPVQGTESRVNAQNDSYEFMLSYLTKLQQSGVKKEHIIGWYHSHPGFGCWLSGIDVQTQKLHQGFEDPYVALVVDPVKSIKDGIVDIGAFRTFYDNHVTSLNKVDSASTTMGWHSKEYYSLDIKLLVNESDKIMLDKLKGNDIGYSKFLKTDDGNTEHSKYSEEKSISENDDDLNSIRIWNRVNNILETIALGGSSTLTKNDDGESIGKSSLYSTDGKSTNPDTKDINSTAKYSEFLMTSTVPESTSVPKQHGSGISKRLDVFKAGVEANIHVTDQLKNVMIAEIQRKLFS